MSRQFEVAADDYAEFRCDRQAADQGGEARLARTRRCARPDRAGLIVGVVPPFGEGLRVRPAARRGGATRTRSSSRPTAARDASSGDEVAVKITKRSRRPGMNLEGRIVQVVTRASGVFVGTYFEEGGAGFVQVDGTTFHDPIYVGDPGAKGAKPGDKVALEMVRYPTPYREGEGVITEILGQRGQPGVDTLTIIRAFNIPDTFDEEALDEAREQAKAVRRGRHRQAAGPPRRPDRHDRPGHGA